MPSVRRLTAILAADVAGYSRLMGADEEGTHERLKAHRHALVDPEIAEHHGRIVKTVTQYRTGTPASAPVSCCYRKWKRQFAGSQSAPIGTPPSTQIASHIRGLMQIWTGSHFGADSHCEKA